MKLYVANLGFHVSSEDLKELFSGYGEVASATVITDRITGKSRGFGFIDMPVNEAAEKAMEKLQNREIEGRNISVSVAKPKSDSGGGGRSFSGDRSSKW